MRKLKIGATPVDEKMRESRLKWLDHVQRRAIIAPMRKSELFKMRELKKVGRPRIILIVVVKNGMSMHVVLKSMTLNRIE